MATRRKKFSFRGFQIYSIIFCLIFLPSVGEKRLVTLNVEASDNHLVSIPCFSNRGLKIVWLKYKFFLSLLRIHCQASDWHCITFNWRPRHDKLKTYCKSLPEWLSLELFDLIEKPFEMASRRKYPVVKGFKSYQTCYAWIFYHLSVKRDLWHWMLMAQTTT
jgi:hypothetical protein